MKELVQTIPQENQESIMNRVLKKHCFGQSNPATTMEMIEDSTKYANREMNEEDYFEMKQKYDEKTFLNLFFEGSRAVMELTEQAFDDERLEQCMTKKGIHPLFVTEDEAKMFHTKDLGTHSPVISTHHIKIGTTHGQTRTDMGLLSDLYKAGYLTEITPSGLIAYAFETHQRIIRADTAKKMCDEINKQHKEQLSALIDGRIGEDKMTKKVLEIISKKGMIEQWSFEKVNNMGIQGRKMVRDLNDTFGKEIGNIIVKQTSENKEELAVNLVEHICKTLGVAFDDMLAVGYYKMMGKTRGGKKNGKQK